MIAFSFNIALPWNRFQTLWNRCHRTPFRNKFVELEVYRNSTLISFQFNWTVCRDHAGLDIELGLAGHAVHFNFYDNRHWNHQKNQ